MHDDLSHIKKRIAEIEGNMNEIKKSPFSQILILTLLAFVMIMVTVYVSHLLGSDYFLIKSDLVVSNKIALRVIPTIIFMLNMFFVFSVSLDADRKKTISMTMCYLPVYILSMLLIGNNLISTGLMPLIFVLATNIDKPKAIMKYIGFGMVFFLAQTLLCIIKTGHMITNNSQMTFNQFHYSIIDLFFIYGVTLLLKEGVKYGLSMGRKLAIVPNIIRDYKQSSDDMESIKKLNELPKTDRIATVSIMFALQITQLLIVLAICKIGNVFAESVVILLMFWATRGILKYCWHSNSLIVCTVSSALIFYVGASASIPMQYSLFCPVVIGVLIAYALYRVSIFENKHNEMHMKLNPSDIEKMEENDIRELCRIRGSTKEETDFAVMAFCWKLPNKELADLLKIEIESVKKKKQRLKSKLKAPQ